MIKVGALGWGGGKRFSRDNLTARDNGRAVPARADAAGGGLVAGDRRVAGGRELSDAVADGGVRLHSAAADGRRGAGVRRAVRLAGHPVRLRCNVDSLIVGRPRVCATIVRRLARDCDRREVCGGSAGHIAAGCFVRRLAPLLLAENVALIVEQIEPAARRAAAEGHTTICISRNFSGSASQARASWRSVRQRVSWLGCS